MLKKSKKWKSRLSAGIMAAILTITMLPTTAFAADGQDSQDSGTGSEPVVLADDTGASGIELSKSAVLENDGTYTINLEAYATGEIVTSVKEKPTDIVLVLDVSGSMNDDMTYVTGEDWQFTDQKVRDMPTNVYHLCPDGTYSPVTWSTENLIYATRYRYQCQHCMATRKWDLDRLGISDPTIPGEGNDDPWNLFEYKATTTTKSQLEVLQEAANTFIDSVAAKNSAIETADEQHRISIVKFASESVRNSIGNDFDRQGYNYTQTVADLTTVNSSGATDLKNDVNSLQASGATAADKGLELAQSVLKGSSSERAKIVIMFTDGSPTYSSGFENEVASAAVTNAKALKDNGTIIYTIGTMSDADPSNTNSPDNKYMNAVSSNYPKATITDAGDFDVSFGEGGNNGYYKAVFNSAGLNDIFEEISESIGTTTVTLNADAVTKDILADGFSLPQNFSNDNVKVSTVDYRGRDDHGNRVFATTSTPLDKTGIGFSGNTITYTGFDFAENCLIDGSEIVDEFTPALQGEKLVITIEGIEATDAAITNGLVNTNNINSGIYENAQAETPAARFLQPKTQLSSKAYVVDYAKEISTADLPNNATNLSVGGMKKFTSAVIALNKGENGLTYGSATADSYTPGTMNWNGVDTYYAFGQWKTLPEGVTTGNNTWTKVNVIPANNVYYEDDFITSESGTVGIEYTGNWSNVTDGSQNSGTNTETPNTDIHGGWQNGSLADDEKYSDGTAHMLEAGATATFTFTGIGVDVYSRTNMETGVVLAELYKGEGTDNTMNMSQFLLVDNYAQSNGSEGYYQIPTVSFTGLDYGTYTVKLTVGAAEGRSTYYLDGIRVYNPLAENTEDLDSDMTVNEAYGDEAGAVFREIRDYLLTTDETGELDPDATIDGPVFLDQTADGQGGYTNSVGEYFEYGPKNEVYLAKGQAITFAILDADKVCVGLKAPAGETKAAVVNGSLTETTGYDIKAASDLFYEVTPYKVTNADGSETSYVYIRNDGPNLLSVTKLKTTGAAEFAPVKLADVISYSNSFAALPVVDYTDEIVDGDQSEAIEPSNPSDSEAGDVVIDNPDETPNQGNTPVQNNPIATWVNKLISGIMNLFGRR